MQLCVLNGLFKNSKNETIPIIPNNYLQSKTPLNHVHDSLEDTMKREKENEVERIYFPNGISFFTGLTITILVSCTFWVAVCLIVEWIK